MGSGCSALVSYFGCLKHILKYPRDDDDDSWDDNDETNDSHDGFDREELLAVAEEGLGPDVLKLTLKNARDGVDDDSNSDSDDGCDGAELLAAAEEGLGPDVLLPILEKNPGLIRTGDTVGNTVLHMAARDGDILTVCRLIAFLEERQDKDLKKVFMDGNVDGDTALHLALKNRHQEIAYCLIKAEDSTKYVSNNDGKRPYTLAKEAGFSEVCELAVLKGVPYIGHADVEIRAIQADLMGLSITGAIHWMDLYRAIKKGNVDVLITELRTGDKELLRHQDSRGKTLLHAAVSYNRSCLVALVRFMVKSHVTDAALLRDKNGFTALHLAVLVRDNSAAQCLIKAEPKTVYRVNHEGVSPLYMAVRAGNHELFECMVSHCCLRGRASEILSHPKHATLAHLAIKARSFGIFKVLLEHLPTLVKAKNENGMRLLSYAANKGSLDEVNYILTNFPKFAEKYDNDGCLPIHKAVGGGHVSIVEAFLKHCPQALHHGSKNGRSVLHIAAINDKTKIIIYLTENVKMDESFLNLKDNKGKTFMDYAKDLKQSV